MLTAEIIQSLNAKVEWSSIDLVQAATARWLSDLDLRERFFTLPDYVQRLQLMRLGIVPMDATLFS